MDFTYFAADDIIVAKITPCLEIRKSMILQNLPNGIGTAGSTELHVFRLLGLYFLKSDGFIKQCVGTFNSVVGQQRVVKNIFDNMDFNLPFLAEQNRIVARIQDLYSVLDKI